MYCALVDTQDDVDVIAEALGHAALLMSRYLNDRSGLSRTAADVLYRLDAEGPVRLTWLASALEISQPSMTQLIHRMERKGLVARSVDPSDRRATLVTITDGGRDEVLVRQQAIRQRLSDRLSLLPAGQRDALRLAAYVSLPITLNLIELEAGRQGRRQQVGG